MVRQGLALLHAGGLHDEVIETLEVLDVDRGPDVDAGLEQLLHILPALGVARGRSPPTRFECASSSTSSIAGRRRSAASRSNSCARDVPVMHRECRQSLQALEQALGFDASVRFDVAHHHVGPAARTLRAASSMA